MAVDECSMVSLELFSLLMKCLVEGTELQKVVLLGDHLQLPSVGPGNLMEDLYTAMNPMELVVNLRTSHRSEGSLIFENATKISQKQMPTFDKSGGFRFLVPYSDKVDGMPKNIKQNCEKLNRASSKPIQVCQAKTGHRQQDEDYRVV